MTANGDVPVNEAIHPSVLARFGQEVVEDVAGLPRRFVYRPRNLAAALLSPDAGRASE